MKKTAFAISCLLTCINLAAQEQNLSFVEIYDLIQKDNYFKAKEIYQVKKNDLPEHHQLFTEAVLDNAFNKLADSENKINKLIGNKENLTDSLLYMLFEIKSDNSIKLFNYGAAKNAIITILSDYKNHLSEKETADYENSLKIWTALENTPVQKVDIKEYTLLKMGKDIAGLNNLNISADDDTVDFIFDTGANLSTISHSTAKKLHIKILPVEISVGAITGAEVSANLGVGEKLSLGNIDVYNVVFLVVPDKELSFPQINYQINGILGFPVISALNEIHISQNGDFVVPKTPSVFSENSNLAMDGLTPLICINKKHFTFDSGADHTLFYHSFYLENKDEIEKNYKPEEISFGGAGGSRATFEGYVIDYAFEIAGNKVTVENIQVVKEKIKENETAYGNIGQDLIRKFETMIMNFDQMFVRFE